MFEDRRPRGILTITVLFNGGDARPLSISFESYPDIFASKEIGPDIFTVDEACLQLRRWLEDFKERQKHSDDEVTKQ